MNQLIKADNLEALKSMEDNCIDLIYIDPLTFFTHLERERLTMIATSPGSSGLN